MSPELKELPVEAILPNPEQPRMVFDRDALHSLARSIKERGLIQAISVERTDDPEQYILIDGERRWRAHKLAGIPHITAVVYPPLGENGDRPQQRLLAALTANIQRVEMNPIEEAHAFEKLYAILKSYQKVANRLGVSYPYVRNRVALLQLEEEIRALIVAGELQKDTRVVEALLSLPTSEIRIAMARRVAKPGVTIPMIETACAKALEKLAEQDAPPVPDEVIEPAIVFATRRDKPINEPMWRELVKRQLVPKWHVVQEAVRLSCRACAFYDSPSEEICGECPAVLLVAKMNEIGREGK